MPGDNSLYFAYFPESLSLRTAPLLASHSFAYAGSYALAASLGLCADNAEPGQLKHAQMIEPDTPKCGLLQPLIHKLSKPDFIFIGGKAYAAGIQTCHYRGTTYEASDRDKDASEFLEQAQRDLAGAGWRVKRP